MCGGKQIHVRMRLGGFLSLDLNKKILGENVGISIVLCPNKGIKFKSWRKVTIASEIFGGQSLSFWLRGKHVGFEEQKIKSGCVV